MDGFVRRAAQRSPDATGVCRKPRRDLLDRPTGPASWPPTELKENKMDLLNLTRRQAEIVEEWAALMIDIAPSEFDQEQEDLLSAIRAFLMGEDS